MTNSFTLNNQTSLKEMWHNIATHLVDSGSMTLESAYLDSGNGEPNYSNVTSSLSVENLVYVFAPEDSMDSVLDQEWRLVVSVRDTYYNLWVVTPTQIIQDATSFSIAKTSGDPLRESGRVNFGNYAGSDMPKKDQHFFTNDVNEPSWSCFQGSDSPEAIPLTYRLTVSDHGLALATWAEGHDKAGDCFNWIVIQRLIKADGSKLTDTHNPLFCIFSKNGGGSSDVNTIEPGGILKFVVREDDVNAPTFPLSAVVPQADSSMIINPIQQVSTSENGKVVASFPSKLNTQRHSYNADIDMICYLSADVMSQGSNIPINVYGETRNYLALNANHSNNKGMRLLIQTS